MTSAPGPGRAPSGAAPRPTAATRRRPKSEARPRQHQLLLALRGLPGGAEATIGALAARLGIRHHSAVELVDRMEAHGLVRRVRGASDRRRVLVRLAPRGHGLLLRLTLAHRAEL